MCCSRDHYPATVGVHQVDSNGHHTHLVLPWARLNHVVCITAVDNPLTMVWRDFNGTSWGSSSANVNVGNFDKIQAVSDLLIVAIAESGRCGHDFFKKLIHRYNRDRTNGGLHAVDYINYEGSLEFKPPPPEEIEEWHEWLVKVAKSEVDDYKKMLTMEKALREAHPELGA